MEELTDKEYRRILLINDCIEGKRSTRDVASLLNISVRQVQRLIRKVSETGNSKTLLHGNKNITPHNKIPEDIKLKIIQLSLNELKDLNYAHLRDVLAEEFNIDFSRSTIERICKDIGRLSSITIKKPKIHKRRAPRTRFGELIQVDATIEPWLATSNKKWALHGAIDDATGMVVGLHFEKEECLEGYVQLMLQVNKKYGLPLEIYADGRTIFTNNKKLTIEEELAGKLATQTNFERAAIQNNIFIHIAKSPQAKGKIERLWRTLHDRLKKDLKRKNITNIKDANRYLAKFIDSYNKKFSREAISKELAWQRKIPKSKLLFDFAVQEERKIDNTFAFRYEGKIYQIPSKIYKENKNGYQPSTVTISKVSTVGIQAKYNGKIFTPEIIPVQPKDITPKIKVQRKPPTPAPDHPWRQNGKKSKK